MRDYTQFGYVLPLGASSNTVFTKLSNPYRAMYRSASVVRPSKSVSNKEGPTNSVAAPSRAGNRICNAPEFLKKLQPINDVLWLGPDLAMTAAIVAKHVATVNVDQAAHIAGVSKGVSIVSSGF